MLAPLGYETGVGRLIKPPATYIVLGGPGWGSPDDMPVCGVSGSLHAPVRIKCVSMAPGDGVLIMSKRVRDLLSPGPGRWTHVDVADRVARIRWERAEFNAVDDTVTGVDGTHPAVAVDTYRLHSVPIGG